MKLSIITINYNNLSGLRKTASSVINQTWRDFEWIIIDGGSTDGSKEYIERLVDNPANNISYWCSEPDKGIYNAMNKGIVKASGEYLCFMNSGDSYFESTTLEKVFEKEHVSDILIGDCHVVDGEKHLFYQQYPEYIELYSILNTPFCHQTMFVRKKVFDELGGYDEKYRIVADHKKWIDAALANYIFENLKFTICHYDVNGMSLSQSKQKHVELHQLYLEYSSLMMDSINRLDYYEKAHQIRRTKALLAKGGIAAKITSAFLRLMDSLFTHVDLDVNMYSCSLHANPRNEF